MFKSYCWLLTEFIDFLNNNWNLFYICKVFWVFLEPNIQMEIFHRVGCGTIESIGIYILLMTSFFPHTALIISQSSDL